MTEPLKKLAKHTKIQMPYILIFTAIFSLLGYILPELYYKYIDKTEYYRTEIPVQLNKKVFSPCDKQIATVKRTAAFDMEVSSTRVLIRVNGANSITRLHETTVVRDNIPVDRTLQPKVVTGTFELPCNLPDGTYYWDLSVRYQYRGNVKYNKNITETFTVSRENAIQ